LLAVAPITNDLLYKVFSPTFLSIWNILMKKG